MRAPGSDIPDEEEIESLAEDLSSTLQNLSEEELSDAISDLLSLL